MPNLRYLMVALALAGLMATGCSSSSSPPSTGPSTDGGSDGSKADAHAADTGVVEGGGVDGGDCAFADFVIGLVNKDTTATATPSTDLGASLEDSQQQSCFASLF